MVLLELEIICAVNSCSKIKDRLTNDGWIVEKNNPYVYDYTAKKDISKDEAIKYVDKLRTENLRDIVKIDVVPTQIMS